MTHFWMSRDDVRRHRNVYKVNQLINFIQRKASHSTGSTVDNQHCRMVEFGKRPFGVLTAKH